MRKLILYLTFNYPSPDTFTRFLDEVSRLPVDYVELGLPTQNPVYDGPAIRQTHSGTRRPSAEEMSRAVKKLHGAGIRTYFLQYFRDIEGQRDTFLTTVNASGADGILLPDLLIDFFQGAEGHIHAVHSHGLDFVPFFNPAMPDRTISRFSSITRSWAYCGLIPSTGINVPYDQGAVVERMLSLLRGREVNFGFGLRSLEDVRKLVSGRDVGVAIGTALIPYVREGDLEGFRKFVTELRGVLCDS